MPTFTRLANSACRLGVVGRRILLPDAEVCSVPASAAVDPDSSVLVTPSWKSTWLLVAYWRNEAMFWRQRRLLVAHRARVVDHEEDVGLGLGVLAEGVGVEALHVTAALQRHHVVERLPALGDADDEGARVGAVVDGPVLEREGDGRRAARGDPRAAGDAGDHEELGARRGARAVRAAGAFAGRRAHRRRVDHHVGRARVVDLEVPVGRVAVLLHHAEVEGAGRDGEAAVGDGGRQRHFARRRDRVGEVEGHLAHDLRGHGGQLPLRPGAHHHLLGLARHQVELVDGTAGQGEDRRHARGGADLGEQLEVRHQADVVGAGEAVAHGEAEVLDGRRRHDAEGQRDGGDLHVAGRQHHRVGRDGDGGDGLVGIVREDLHLELAHAQAVGRDAHGDVEDAGGTARLEALHRIVAARARGGQVVGAGAGGGVEDADADLARVGAGHRRHLPVRLHEATGAVGLAELQVGARVRRRGAGADVLHRQLAVGERGRAGAREVRDAAEVERRRRAHVDVRAAADAAEVDADHRLAGQLGGGDQLAGTGPEHERLEGELRLRGAGDDHVVHVAHAAGHGEHGQVAHVGLDHLEHVAGVAAFAGGQHGELDGAQREVGEGDLAVDGRARRRVAEVERGGRPREHRAPRRCR